MVSERTTVRLNFQLKDWCAFVYIHFTTEVLKIRWNINVWEEWESRIGENGDWTKKIETLGKKDVDLLLYTCSNLPNDLSVCDMW